MISSNETRKNFSPLQILGWLTGGLSLLNLIEELSPVKIDGNLKKWLDAYTGFVEKIGGFLFGWINLGWIQVSNLEMHVLVLSTVLIAAHCRAHIQLRKAQEDNPFIIYGMPLFFALCFFAIVLLPTLLLPLWFGLLGGALGLLFLIVGMLFLEQPEFAPTKKATFNELIGVAAVFFFLVALNYTVFKSWS